MMENGQYQPGPDPDQNKDKDKKNQGNGLGALIRMMFGGGPQGRVPPWSTRRPDDIQTLLRQLSANAGQMPMPGGFTGAVRPTPFHGQRQMGGQLLRSPMMDTYGQTGGEANFFAQTTRGGMSPVSSLGPMGRPLQWNPFDAWRKQIHDKPDGKDPKADDDKKDPPRGGTGRPGLDDMGGNR